MDKIRNRKLLLQSRYIIISDCSLFSSNRAMGKKSMCLTADGKFAGLGLANSCFCGVASHFLFKGLIVALRCLSGLHTTGNCMLRRGFRRASLSTVKL